jgi:signal transduction histidine kinase
VVDEARLRTAVTNLVRNALAYSAPDSTVHVRLRIAGERVIVSVADEGRGLAPGDRDRVFDPFVRGQGGSGRNAGVGLGLFITRRIVEAHGGSVWAEPAEQGTTFHIALPRSKAGTRGGGLSESGPAT